MQSNKTPNDNISPRTYQVNMPQSPDKHTVGILYKINWCPLQEFVQQHTYCIWRSALDRFVFVKRGPSHVCGNCISVATCGSSTFTGFSQPSMVASKKTALPSRSIWHKHMVMFSLCIFRSKFMYIRTCHQKLQFAELAYYAEICMFYLICWHKKMFLNLHVLEDRESKNAESTAGTFSCLRNNRFQNFIRIGTESGLEWIW